jgi:hypothetical protein
MLAATRFTTRRRGFLGAIKEPLANLRQPMLDSGTGEAGGTRNVKFLPPPSWGSTGGTTQVNWMGPAIKSYWFTAAVGPTAGGSGPGASQPPGFQTPAGAAVNTVNGGNGNGGTLAPASGASATPVATEPTATILPAPPKSWWPWVIAGVVAAGVSAYFVSR